MTPAADDFAAIRAAAERIRADAVPRCPIVGVRTLHDCLRSPTRCTTECPYRDDWLGPEAGQDD